MGAAGPTQPELEEPEPSPGPDPTLRVPRRERSFMAEVAIRQNENICSFRA